MATASASPFRIPAGATVYVNRLVKNSSGTAILNTATASDVPIGVVQASLDGDFDSGDTLAVRDIKDGGTQRVVAAGSVSIGADIYAADAGKVQASPGDSGSYHLLGWAMEAASGNNSIIEAYLYPAAEIDAPLIFGTQANTAGSGIALTSSAPGVVRVFADDGNAVVASSVRIIQGRMLIEATQAGGTIRSLQGQMKLVDGVNLGTGVYTPVQGYIELMGDHTIASAGKVSCFDASVEIASGKTLTIASGGFFAGIKVETTGTGSFSNSGTCAAFMLSNASGAPAWPYGLFVGTDDCVNGIYIGSTTQAHEFVVSALPADARGARYAFTCATPAMSDGYGAHEIDLTITGTGTGGTYAASCWVNATGASTLKASAHHAIHNDGVYLDNSATTTNAMIAYARVHFVFGTNTGYDSLHLFDLNLDVDQDMTSLIDVNNLDLLGYASGAHSSAVVGSLPFTSTAGAAVKWIRLYGTAA